MDTGFNPELRATNMYPVQQWNSGHYFGGSNESEHGHYRTEESFQQPVYYHEPSSAGPAVQVDAPPQFVFGQRFLQPPLANEFSDTESRGWNDLEAGRGRHHYYSEVATSSSEHPYRRANNEYIYSRVGEPDASVSDPYARQHLYHFHNQMPVQGPTGCTTDSVMTYQAETPFTTFTTDQDTYEHPSPCSTSTSSDYSPSATIEESSSSTSTLQTSSPQLRCTFSHYVPSRSKSFPKKKPAMACLFCRLRKIACSPPLQGSAETRCNQCVRREINCQYPKESRRGHYRRLQYLERVGREVTEKIAELERQSVEIAPSEPEKGVRKLPVTAAVSTPY